MDANVGHRVRAGAEVGSATTTLIGVANRVNIHPFVLTFDYAADRLSVNATMAVAGVYAADEQGRPTGRITETGDLVFATVGAKEATVSTPFKTGRQCWISIRHSSTAVISALQAYTSPDLDLTATATSPNKTPQRNLAYAAAAPASWEYVRMEAATTLAAAIWMRVG